MNEQISLRDYFAGQTLAGIFANPNTDNNLQNDVAAFVSYAIADAMIKEREKNKE